MDVSVLWHLPTTGAHFCVSRLPSEHVHSLVSINSDRRRKKETETTFLQFENITEIGDKTFFVFKIKN